MYCKYCGKDIDDNSTFCKYCGKPLNHNGANFSIEPIKRFVISNKKAAKIAIILLFCGLMCYLWFLNTPSGKIVGEWVWENRYGTVTQKFNYDGSYVYSSESSYGVFEVTGNWVINGNTLTTTFWSREEQKNLSDSYEIITLNSNELVYKYVKGGWERHFKRKK